MAMFDQKEKGLYSLEYSLEDRIRELRPARELQSPQQSPDDELFRATLFSQAQTIQALERVALSLAEPRIPAVMNHIPKDEREKDKGKETHWVCLSREEREALDLAARRLAERGKSKFDFWIVLSSEIGDVCWEAIGNYVLQMRSTETSHFYMPRDFAEASFEGFEFLCEGHKTAYTLLHKFGPNPPRGLYLWGTYGTGKTHLTSAFARTVRAELAAKHVQRITDFAESAVDFFKEGANEKKAGTIEDQSYIQRGLLLIYQSVQRRNPYQVTDIAFATFDYLFERSDDKKFLEDFLSRRVLIIDDIHPKGNPDRYQFITRVIEHRYNEARTGATFLTSNLAPDNLLLAETLLPREVAERAYSRLREMCMPIQFEAPDYRLKIAEERDKEMMDLARTDPKEK